MVSLREVEAGTEIDLMVAKMLWGLELVLYTKDRERLIATSVNRLEESLDSGWIGYDSRSINDPESFCIELPEYSTRLGKASILLDEMTKNGHISIIGTSEKWTVRFSEFTGRNNLEDCISCNTLPLAICKSFLQFKNVNEI